MTFMTCILDTPKKSNGCGDGGVTHDHELAQKTENYQSFAGNVVEGLT